jgi:hypothetical protein
VQLSNIVVAGLHPGRAQQRCCFGHRERQVTGADLQELSLGAQPRGPQRRLGPACQHQP